MTPDKQIFYSTPNALDTTFSALEYDIIWKELISSGGTAAICTNDVAGSSTFFAPLSKHTCKVFASFSPSTAKILFFNIVPPCKFYAFSKAISSL